MWSTTHRRILSTARLGRPKSIGRIGIARCRCYRHTHASVSSGQSDTSSISTGTLSFTATYCRDYKFYSKHRNADYSTSSYKIDQAEGVNPFEAAC